MPTRESTAGGHRIGGAFPTPIRPTGTTSGVEPAGPGTGDIRYISDPATGRRFAQEYVEPVYYGSILVEPGGWQTVDEYFPQDASAGSGGIDPAIHWAQIELDKQRVQLEREGLSESIRANQASEADAVPILANILPPTTVLSQAPI